MNASGNEYSQGNLLVLLQKLVELSQVCKLHDQHKILGLADSDHPDNVGVVQLLHDTGLPQHLITHGRVVVIIFQDLHCHRLLCPGMERRELLKFDCPLSLSVLAWPTPRLLCYTVL